YMPQRADEIRALRILSWVFLLVSVKKTADGGESLRPLPLIPRLPLPQKPFPRAFLPRLPRPLPMPARQTNPDKRRLPPHTPLRRRRKRNQNRRASFPP